MMSVRYLIPPYIWSKKFLEFVKFVSFFFKKKLFYVVLIVCLHVVHYMHAGFEKANRGRQIPCVIRIKNNFEPLCGAGNLICRLCKRDTYS